MDMTTFYFPGSRENLRMSTEDTESSSLGEDDQPSEEEKISDDLMIGFVGTQDNDTSYEALLQHIDFNWEFEELDFESDDEVENEVAKAVCKNRSPMFQVRRESIPDEVKAEVVLNWLYKSRTRDQEALRLGVTTQMISNVIYEFQIIKRASKRTRKSIIMKHNKITKRHIKSIKKFIEDHSGTWLTLESARRNLIQDFPETKTISLSTLSLLFRDKLKLSYKKLGNTNPSKALPDNRTNLVSWCKTVLGLLEKGFYLIFIDEFLVNRNTINTYGWTQKGMPGRLLRLPTGFKMSFVVAHGTSRVEGIMGTKTTFNQNKYIKFLKTLLLKIKQSRDYDQQQIVVIADNWRFHRTEHVRSLFLNERVTWLFIPPYWPEINPWEKLINFIKGYVKSQVNMDM